MSIHYLQECINFELKIGDKLCNCISLYRSPSQSQDEFEKFSENLERNLDDLLQNNPFLVVVISDFNVKSNNWYCRDKSSLEADTVDNITKEYGLHQVIRETTHILDNTSSTMKIVSQQTSRKRLNFSTVSSPNNVSLCPITANFQLVLASELTNNYLVLHSQRKI